MKSFNRLLPIFFILGLVPLVLHGAAGVQQRFDVDLLKHTAEHLGFGFKTANLLELLEVAKDMPEVSEGKITVKVQVPEFIGIPSNAIKELFKANGLDLDVEWQKAVGDLNPRKLVGLTAVLPPEGSPRPDIVTRGGTVTKQSPLEVLKHE